MLKKTKLVQLMAAGTALITVGCAAAPTAMAPTADSAAMQEQQELFTPEQLMQLSDERQLMATSGMTFEQLMAGVPQELSAEDGNKLLVDIDESAISTLPLSVQQYYRRHFIRRFHSPFFFRHRPIRFFRHHSFFFPFHFDGFRHRPFFIHDDFPFFFFHRRRFHPFFIHRPFFFHRPFFHHGFRRHGGPGRR